jgi:Membrane-bound serine protease (ClpP class)
MSASVIALLVVGLVLLGFEVIVPGAVLGIAGTIAMLAGVVIAFAQEGVSGGLLAIAVSLVAVCALLYVEFRVLPRTRWGRRMFLDKAIDGASQPPVADRGADVIGREAIAVTALGPTGIVEVAGRRYEARCDSGFADAGARLKVVRVETFQLVVIASD